MMRPRVLILSSALDTAPRSVVLARPMTVAEIVEAQSVALDLPTIAVLTDPAGNTRPVLRGEWHVRQVTPGHQLAFVPVPAGGSLKSILSAVASIALAIIAPWAAGALAGVMGLTGTAATIASGVIGAGIMIAGQFILNRLLPQQSNTGLTAEAVYTARASSNRAMPNEVIPVLYGLLRYPPPYAARPYAEFVDNDQYLYQLHCISAGHADPLRWEIGDTLVWTAEDGFQGSFAGGDTKIEIVRPGEVVKLFPANVVAASTVDGQQVPDAPEWLGPFAVSAPGTEVSRIACDYVFSLGLVHINKKGKASSVSRTVTAQYRLIDNAGNALGPWTNLFSSTHNAATRTPQRFSKSADVPAGRYEVRFGASGADASDNTGSSSTLNRVVWAGLRGYVEGFVTPPDVTLVATRIRATEHLSREAAGQYLFTCQRRLPVWDQHDGWSAPVATRNPAWAVADLLKALGIDDHEYDLGWLASYADLWETRGDRFDALFDRRWQASEALDAILRAGRSYHVRLGSIIGFVRDEPRQVRRMAFGPDTVVRGSIRRHDVWFSEDSPDHLEVVYLDGETWTEKTVVAAIGAIGQDKPQQLSLFGITQHDHAWREGIFQAGENAYRRSFRTFQVEREGRMLVRGDAVVVADPLHELVGFARLTERVGDVLTLDRPFDAPPGETCHISLRDKRGREWGPCKLASIDGATITLDAADRAVVEAQHGALNTILPDPSKEERAHVTLLVGEDRLFDGLLVEARPVGTELWEVTLVNDDQTVHVLDQTEIKPSPWTAPAMVAPAPDKPALKGVYAELHRGTLVLELHAGWQPAAGADSYVAEISYDDDAVALGDVATWTPVHNGAATRLIAQASPQPLTLRVAPIGKLQGDWVYRSIDEVPGLYLPDEVVDPILDEANQHAAEQMVPLQVRFREVYEDAQRIAWQAFGQDVEQYGDVQRSLSKMTAVYETTTAEYRHLVEVMAGPDSALALDIRELRSALLGKAEVSALNATILRVTDAENALTVQGSAISGMQAILDGKADITALNQVDIKITDLGNVVEAQGTALSGIQTQVDGVSATGLFRTDVVATEAGAEVTVGISAAVLAGGATTEAAVLISALANGKSIIGFLADMVYFKDPAGRFDLFVLESGTAYINRARIRDLDATNITAEKIDAKLILQNGTVIEDLIDVDVFSRFEPIYYTSTITREKGGTYSEGQWTHHGTIIVNKPADKPCIEFVNLEAYAYLDGQGSRDAYIGIKRNGSSTNVSAGEDFGQARAQTNTLTTLSASRYRGAGLGETTIRYDIWTYNECSAGNNSSVTIRTTCDSGVWVFR